jgi:broad specificity phosphatase PhoE
MRVGLVRHFKVKKKSPDKAFITQTELTQWFDEYDVSDIEDGTIDFGAIEWGTCFASDMPRAVKTAEKIYSRKIIELKELREIPAYPIFKRNIKLPFLLWAVLTRLAWLINHKSQLESISDVKKRIEDVLDEILVQSGQDVLIVSHGALMIYIRKALLQRGFKGPKFTTPANGKLYLFEK